LGSLTDQLPKPMLPITGPYGKEPLLKSIIRKLRAASFEDVVLVVGYRSEVITDYFQGAEGIRFVRQDRPLGTAAALEVALPLLEPYFFLTYGDLVVDENEYRGIRSTAQREGGSWAAVDRREQPVGAVYIENGRIVRMIEKPQTCTTNWNAPGLFVLTGEAAALSSATAPSVRGERELAQMLQMWIDQGNELHPFYVTSDPIDIGVLERYKGV
jgi:NDP-sugar pyrophosphorylase family protein